MLARSLGFFKPANTILVPCTRGSTTQPTSVSVLVAAGMAAAAAAAAVAAMATYGDVLLGVDEVRVKHVGGPHDAGALVGGGEGEAGGGAGGTADQAVQVGALLVGAALLDSVALRALGLEDLGTLWHCGSIDTHTHPHTHASVGSAHAEATQHGQPNTAQTNTSGFAHAPSWQT